MFYLQCHFTGLVGLGRELVGQFTAYHQFDDLFCSQVLCRLCCDPGTVTHDGDFICDPQDLCHLVRNIDNTASSVTKHIDDLEQMLHFFFRQG